jgi:hypothetical protein
MKPVSEAITCLKAQLNHEVFCVYYAKANNDQSSEIQHSILMNSYRTALIALEKQIPAKPRENMNWDDVCNDEDFVDEHWLCHGCENYLDESEEYCRLCGQRIDWSMNQ